MRTLVLNSPELRGALRVVYEGGESLTEEEWQALLGARRQLESAAGRQRREWLREALAESGLPRPIQWVIEKRLKSRDFTTEELEAEIKTARDRMERLAVIRRALARSGLPTPLQWAIENRLVGREFTTEELEAEIKTAREVRPEAAQGEGEGLSDEKGLDA